MNRRNFVKSLAVIPAISVITLPAIIPKKETETEKLARWWNTLNDWEWPNDMPGKPDGFDDWPDVHPHNVVSWRPSKYDYDTPIMLTIKKIIGHKECLRWHWLHNLNKTNGEFEEWYQSYEPINP